MKIQIIKCLQDNYSYLIIDETNLNACVVDPSEAKPIIDFVESNKINLKYIRPERVRARIVLFRIVPFRSVPFRIVEIYNHIILCKITSIFSPGFCSGSL